MILFTCDYNEGAHPRIIERLAATNLEQNPGYGMDAHSAAARGYISELTGVPAGRIHFLVGGTQTNFTLIAAALRPHEGVLSPETGHINVHESGAVEATGHKVITLPPTNGKITAAQAEAAFEAHFNDATHEHIVKPAMIYISEPTETGTVYSIGELRALRDTAHKYGATLYVDGARLGYAMASAACDFTLRDLAETCDAFYIGGTKVGALFGEALVIANESLGRDFRYIMKQRGAMLAKGRLLGIQFETLFEDGLYFEISKHAVALAMRVRDAFLKAGCPFYAESPTNQQFPLITPALRAHLEREFVFEHWGERDGLEAVRFATSWATTEEQVAALEKSLAVFSATAY